MMMSRRTALFLFLASFIIFAVLLMPVSIVLAMTGLNNKISYSNSTGSIFSMGFSDLSAGGVYIGDVEFSPTISAILFGDIVGNIKFSGLQRQGDFGFSFDGNDVLSFEELHLLTPIALQTRIGNSEGLLRLHSEKADISLTNGCYFGTFTLTTTALDDLFRLANIPAPEISGQGVCRIGGMIDVNLKGQTQELSLEVSGNVASNQDWSKPVVGLAAVIEPPAGRTFAANIKQLFETAGLSPAGRGYRLSLTSGAAGNS